jgi:hypothetical protein
MLEITGAKAMFELCVMQTEQSKILPTTIAKSDTSIDRRNEDIADVPIGSCC